MPHYLHLLRYITFFFVKFPIPLQMNEIVAEHLTLIKGYQEVEIKSTHILAKKDKESNPEIIVPINQNDNLSAERYFAH